jgi:hypothetical protein
MLNKVESRVMDYIFAQCRDGRTSLLTPKQLLNYLMPKIEITAKELDVIMGNLALDDYIDSEKGVKEGHAYYIVGLTIKGAAYDRERQSKRAAQRNSILWKLGLTVGGAILSWAILKILGIVG